MNEQLQDRRDFEDSLNDQAHAGFGLRATPKNWAAFNEGLTHTINANQQARQGTAPEGNPVLSQAIHGPGITDSSSEAELLNYQYQLSGLGGEYSLQPMSGGASKRVRLEMSLEDQLTAHKQRLQYLREIEAEQSSEWRDMNASEAARLAAKRPTPDATPEWIQEGQASSAGFYAGLKDRAVQNGGLSGFGLYYGAHIGGLLADTGYHLTRSGYGAYQLLTDSQARSDAWNNLSYALTHPGEVVSGLQQGLNSWLAKPFGQQADDLFQIGTTALAGSVGVVGRLKVPGGVTNGVVGANKTLTTTDFPEVAVQVSQKQFRHIAGRPEHAARGGGYLNSIDDAQAVLDAYRSGSATILGRHPQGFPVIRVEGITGTNVNIGAGITNQPTNVFMIKGTASPSVVPINPNWKPK